MPLKKRDRPLSELEGCVLGELWKRGPCTPYSVRRMFLDSPSSHWSGSAGAVYPVLERLERRGLVRSTHAARGAREAWSYALTSTGRKRFLAWLEPPFGTELASVPPDPLRTRLSFLGVLPAARRARFLLATVEALQRELDALEAHAHSDPTEELAHAGALAAMRARLRWFRSRR